ncbi:glycoside hydrolase family 1 protein [Clostridium folliculivorans]|uniref:Beta-glucosidase n=1 Tax=Clostridium folliculivorans TaxID=2886038 RepID=A0A9W5Y1T7_9CLOT|nr:glycoside hydrolase family 1 protein [Clostridium folliculivorans]GKU24927.1 beta-glucosidase [Clostridium folliculivorans]GKU31025.1 beta-glucosidase [Clostridium folliculivorans]
MANYKLPKDFFFGAAMSGPQTEGAHNKDGKLPSVWDHWSDLEINAFHNNVGSYVGNDFYNKYEEDIKILKSLNLKSYRTSIQWSRLLDKDGNLNPKGVEFYHKVIDCSLENGIDVFMNLHHFDLPQYLQDRGGWLNREVVEAYANFARLAFKEFGSKVKHWFTFNEPIVVSMQMYMSGAWYPYEVNYKKGMLGQYHITLAHCLAVREFNKLKAEGTISDSCDIGLINNFAPPYTKENPSKEDLEAVRMTDGIHNRWWLDVCSKGTLPKDILDTLEELGLLPDLREGDEGILSCGKVDWLGFNYYQPARVQAPAEKFDEYGNPKFSDPYIWPERKMNVYRGWEIYPKGIYDFAMKITKECPGLPFFISENGMGVEGEEKYRNADGLIEDDYRIDFVKEHLEWVARAIEDGADCRGYHYWGAIDNWSWNNAFKNRYGFVSVDLANKYTRVKKKSAAWIKAVAGNNEII